MTIQRYSVTPHPIDALLTWVKSGEIAIPEIMMEGNFCLALARDPLFNATVRL